MYRDPEDYVIATMATAASTALSPDQRIGGPFHEEYEHTVRRAFVRSGLGAFLWDSRHLEPLFVSLVAKGWSFILWLSRLPPKYQIYVFHEALRMQIPHSLGTAIFQLEHTDQSYESNAHLPQHIEPDSLRTPKEGWRLAVTRGWTIPFDGLFNRTKLRKAGYIFWDVERLHHDWNLSITTSSCLGTNETVAAGWHREPHLDKRPKAIRFPRGSFSHKSANPLDVFRASENMLAWRPRGLLPMSAAEIYDLVFLL